jgi:plasmid stability protein
MATLYVEKVPDMLYEALRERARRHGKSIAAEVLALLEENVPTMEELARRKEFLQRAQRIRARRTRVSGPLPTSEQMQREDRRR